jgi:hypothetical protein
MLQLGLTFVKRFFPQLMLPFTITVGFIGYSIENYLRAPVKVAERPKSISELREERRLKDLDNVGKS